MAVQVTKRHPIRGFIWGIFFGLGLALIAIGQGYAALGTLPPFILVIAGIVIGTLWGLFAPAKKPKGEPPPEPVQVEKIEPSRFDDFSEDVVADHHTGEPMSVDTAESAPEAPGSEVTSPAGERISEAPAAHVDESADDVADQSGDEGEPTSPDAR